MLQITHTLRQMVWVIAPVLLSVLTAFSANAKATVEPVKTPAKGVPATAHVSVFERHEFMRFEDFNGKTLLKELRLAPKAAVKLKDPDKAKDPKWIEGFAKKHNGIVDTKLFRVPSGIHLMVEFRNGADQNELLANLNWLLADQSVADISPVFYVNNREAIVTGITLVFATPISRTQLEQMFHGYGDIKDLYLSSVDKFGTWDVTLRDRLFTLPADIIVKEGNKSPRRRFDMHLLLLANLLESQQLFKGVPIKSARPVFSFLEEPLSASMTVDWSSETIGAVRRLVLSVTIPNESEVVFDPKRIQEFYTGTFLPQTEDSDPVRQGWFLFADEDRVPLKKNPGWKMTKKSVQLGARTVTVYEYTQLFYVFQPDTAWRIPDLTIRYQTIAPNGERSDARAATAPAQKFYVFSHEKIEGGVLMPAPAPYKPSAQILAFIAPPAEVVPDANAHPYAAFVAKWGEKYIAAAWSAFLVLGIVFVGAGIGVVVRAKKREEAKMPKALPFISDAEFMTALDRISAIKDERVAMIALQKLATTIIVARLPMLTTENVTINRLKEARRISEKNYPESKDAFTTAIELFDNLAAIDAPPEMFIGKSEKARELLAQLYRELSSLRPKTVTVEAPNGIGSAAAV